MILAGDVGGTKTVLAIFQGGLGSLDKVREQSYASKDFGHLADMCAQFLAADTRTHVNRACFGVPGAVADGRCRTTNLPWALDERELAAALRIERVVLVNDLQAGALGALHLRDDETALINPGHHPKNGHNVAILSPGTGLGEGLLAWDGSKHIPVASEGGHSSFAPADARQDALLTFLRRKHEGHVSWERVLSGPGLVSLYEFVCGEGDIAESPAVKARFATDDAGKVIGTCAVAQTDALCVAAVALFCELLASEAGNTALKFMALGGVFLGGGIAPKLLPALLRSRFVESFANKGRFAGLLKGVRVSVALNDKAPLWGAARFAAQVAP